MTSEAEAAPSARRWITVLLLWFVCFINYADRQAIFSVFPLLKKTMSLTDVQLGVVGSSFMWMYAFFGPCAGWLVDRLPRKTVILAALVFWSAATAATALTNDFRQLVFCRALGGLGEAFYFPAAMSLISDYHGSGTRSKAMSLHQSGVYAGTIAGGAVSGFVGQIYGWRSSFSAFGCAGIVLACVLAAFLREPSRGALELAPGKLTSPAAERKGLLPQLLQLLRNPAVVLLICVFAGANFVAVVFLTWTPTFLVQKFHMSLSMAGLNGTAYQQISSVLGVLIGGVVADHMVKRIPAGRWITQAAGLLCGVPFLFLMGTASRIGVLLIAMSGFGFFKGIYDANLFAGLYDVVPYERRGLAAGLLNSLGWVGGGFAPVLVALAAAHFGFSNTFSATAAVYLLIAGLLSAGTVRFFAPKKMHVST